MRQIKYFCDCCTREITEEEANLKGPHPIFNDYSIAAASGSYVCQTCRPKLNEAADQVIAESQVQA